MNFSEDDIDQYCKGKLSEEQKSLFETALQQDKQLAEAVLLRKAIIKGLQETTRDELRKTLQTYSREINDNSAARPFSFILKIAAAVIPISIGLVWYFTSYQQSDLYGEYYTYYPNYEINITRGETDTTTRAIGFIGYGNKKFETALTAFTENISKDEQDYASRFYRGLTYLELKKYDEALLDLEATMQSQSRYATTASWYAALTALKINDNEKALAWLEKLSSSDNAYKEKSLKLIGKIKK